MVERLGVLIVDDDQSIVRSLYRVLYRKYRIYTASGGLEGIACLQHNSIAVVISDMRMPEMKGTEFLQRVSTSWPDVVRILLTGYSSVEDSKDVDVFCYLHKPWDNQELTQVVEEAAEQYRKR